MAPRYSFATPRDDGGTDFFSPDGKKTTLFGPSVAQFGATLPRPPSLATSEAAMADASGTTGVPGFDMQAAHPVDAPRSDTAAPVVPVANGWGTAQAAPGAPATVLPGLTPEAAGSGFGFKAPKKDGGGSGSSEADVRAALRLQEPPRADGKAKPAGGAIGIDDVSGPAPPASEAEAKAQGWSSLDDAKAAFRAALEARTRAGAGATKAHWQDTTATTVREGVDSDATNAERLAAIDAAGAAEGRKAEVARGLDQADAAALREAARRSQGTEARLESSRADEEQVLLNREARLRGKANESELGFRDGPLKALDDAGTRYSESSNAMLGDAILTSANGGGDVAGVLSATQRAKEARLARQDRLTDEADKARLSVPQLRRGIEQIKSEEYANRLERILKANAGEYKAAGRLPELEATLAALAEKKAALKGAREAALMGTTTSGKKFVPATSGGANLAKALEQYGERMAQIGQVEAANEARALAAAAKDKGGGKVVIGGQRVPVDPSLPAEARNQIFKEAEAQQKASTALTDIERARAELGWRRFLPDYLQGQTGAQLRAGIQEYARHESVAQGQSGLMDADRRAAEGLFGGAYDAEGAIKQKRGSLKRIERDLKRRATGED